ncbi:tetratricopeptide repeat protein [Psychrobacter sp. 2Y5]|uniref:tetratricopeptide repeat protein n=1 Tax=unclassified Psychrobacter TaxID=196806 RepID=UPI003F477E15
MHRLKSFFISLALFAAASPTLFAAPFTPDDDQQILATLPTDSPPPRYLTTSDFISGNTNTSPEQTRQLLERAYLQGDPRALGQAQAQLDQSDEQNVETLMLRARALQAAHKFDEAKGVLEQILNQKPSDPDALLTLSSLLLVQGQFDEAMSYCNRLNDASLRVYQLACVAQIHSMTGKLSQAKETLSGLASLAPGLDTSTARWIYLIQADAALRSQDASLAKEVFAVMDSQTVPTLMARADWLLAQGEYDKVRQLLQEHTDKDALLLKLISAQVALKDPKAQQNLALMQDRIEVWRIRQENAHKREQANYALLSNQIDLALKLAQENWQQQRETADIAIYTTAAIKANSQADIEIIEQFIKDTGFEYPALERSLNKRHLSKETHL